jgi:hypothetical protein
LIQQIVCKIVVVSTAEVHKTLTKTITDALEVLIKNKVNKGKDEARLVYVPAFFSDCPLSKNK